MLQNAVKLALAYSSYLGTEDAAYFSAMTTLAPVLSVEFDEEANAVVIHVRPRRAKKRRCGLSGAPICSNSLDE